MDDLNHRRGFALAAGGMAFAGLARAQAASPPSPGAGPDPRPAADGLQHVEVNGTRLAYERHAGGGGTRRPLVFVHGYALRGTGQVYAPLLGRLATAFDVYALDMRGHGGSASSFAGWSQAALADDVAAFVEKLGLRGAVYAGHSLGGFTGMFAQVRHPGTFSALALLATAVAAGGSAPDNVADAFVARGRDRAFLRDAFASMFVRPGPGDVERSVDAVSLLDPSVHRAFFPNYGRNVITDRLAEVRVPVLLVNGAKDTVVSLDEQHRTARGLPMSKEVVFSGEGHMLPIELPGATAREMLNFFLHDVGETFRT